MKIALRNFHKYISLLISVQLLLWTISGIYFSFNKIENVRGEQYLVKGLDALKQSSELSEKLSFEESIKIIEERTTLNPISVVLIEDLMRGSEYRGRELPLYKVVSINEDDEEINVYQNPFSGEVVAIRSTQWRIWDLMWGLHIMDWVDRDNIGNIWLKIFSFIALFSSVSGIVLFFYRK
ncbi:MAG TPA: PepSY domain-containing protein [SAR86 cluster bacterium]|nr:PepSY domain-containing protein [SAR86 cluster bacterium]|tara:strand:- start:540 stop:1079 length:540 start_codon:yes stop_codon:yes gene_type:complete